MFKQWLWLLRPESYSFSLQKRQKTIVEDHVGLEVEMGVFSERRKEKPFKQQGADAESQTFQTAE